MPLKKKLYTTITLLISLKNKIINELVFKILSGNWKEFFILHPLYNGIFFKTL